MDPTLHPPREPGRERVRLPKCIVLNTDFNLRHDIQIRYICDAIYFARYVGYGNFFDLKISAMRKISLN